VEVCQTAAGIIQVKGEGRAECAGALLHGLLAARRLAVVTIDLSELRSISSLALGVLGAYQQCVARSGGQVRLAGMLSPAVKDPLARATPFDLFEASMDAGPAPDIHAIHQPQAAPRSPRGGP
jgi:anti-anti-sigma regulatory factor